MGWLSLQVLELRAKELLARVCVAAARLGEHRLALVLPQPLGERLEGIGDIVGDTLGMRSGIVRVEVFWRSGS